MEEEKKIKTSNVLTNENKKEKKREDDTIIELVEDKRALRLVSKAAEERMGENIVKCDFVYEMSDVNCWFIEDVTIHVPIHIGTYVDVTVLSYLKPTTPGARFYTLILKNRGYDCDVFVTSPEFEIEDERIYGDRVCCPTKSFRNGTLKFRITFEIQPKPRNLSTSLYEETEMTDFDLCADDGAVKVHKVIIAIASPVFRAMLLNDWKQKNEGRVEVPEAKKEVLELFKKYIYLHTIDKNASAENLLQLLQLANCYMMPGLQGNCLRLIEEKNN